MPPAPEGVFGAPEEAGDVPRALPLQLARATRSTTTTTIPPSKATALNASTFARFEYQALPEIDSGRIRKSVPDVAPASVVTADERKACLAVAVPVSVPQ